MIGHRLWYSGAAGEATAAGFEVLDEFSVLPRDLLPRMAVAASLVVAEPCSFPFESLRDADWDVPMAVAVPPGGVSPIRADLGAVALRRLGALDRLVCSPDAWPDAAGEFGWVDQMRSDSLTSAAAALGDRRHKGRFRARAVEVARVARAIHWESIALFGEPPVGGRLEGYDSGGAPGAADLVLVTDPPGDADPARWWDARSEAGSLVIVAEVVGSAARGVRRLRDEVLAAGPPQASLQRVVSVPEPGRVMRRDAVLEFGVA